MLSHAIVFVVGVLGGVALAYFGLKRKWVASAVAAIDGAAQKL